VISRGSSMGPDTPERENSHPGRLCKNFGQHSGRGIAVLLVFLQHSDSWCVRCVTQPSAVTPWCACEKRVLTHLTHLLHYYAYNARAHAPDESIIARVCQVCQMRKWL
jgi:hypothetical protein